jgi:GNAT superfamily N-acetyltransferase
MSPDVSIRFANQDDIPVIGWLAQQIWPAAYQDILSGPQLEYMLQFFYSPSSLLNQMEEQKHQFVILESGDEPLGFASYSESGKAGQFRLHKLYVLPGQQGKGLGRLLLEFVKDNIRALGAHTLLLNVNRFNQARKFYEKLGFQVIGEEDNPIGQNYFMNDYVMQTEIGG